jgi:hypothetical protein
MKFKEPTKLHRKSGLWGIGVLFEGDEERPPVLMLAAAR